MKIIGELFIDFLEYFIKRFLKRSLKRGLGYLWSPESPNNDPPLLVTCPFCKQTYEPPGGRYICSKCGATTPRSFIDES